MPQMVEMLYRPIEYLEIDTNLFSSFIRRQIVEDWWYKADGQWIVKSDPFIDDWSEADYISLVQHLRNTDVYKRQVPGSGASRYCPACAKKIRREKSNESKRRSREQKRIACMNCPQKMTD